MEQMIDLELLKRLRKKRCWSQDELASISGLSLRTVQRIETSGRCSMESQKALAAAFDIEPAQLEQQRAPEIQAPMLTQTEPLASMTESGQSANFGGKHWGYFGAAVGMASSYAGIAVSLSKGSISYGEAGLYFGIVGALCGVCCGTIGLLSKRLC